MESIPKQEIILEQLSSKDFLYKVLVFYYIVQSIFQYQQSSSHTVFVRKRERYITKELLCTESWRKIPPPHFSSFFLFGLESYYLTAGLGGALLLVSCAFVYLYIGALVTWAAPFVDPHVHHHSLPTLLSCQRCFPKIPIHSRDSYPLKRFDSWHVSFLLPKVLIH